MKRRFRLLVMAFVTVLFVTPAFAFDLGDVRLNARFLTDRMAFELNLNQRQYNDLYEINYDFFVNVNPYISAMARYDVRAIDAYYRYLDERNDDLRWILPSAAYVKFMSIDYFFRPICAMNNMCYIRVYKAYPDRHFFYFGLPPHYYTYSGAHGRKHCGGISFYKKNFRKHYGHKIYTGYYQCRPEYRPHDFGRPATSVRPDRPLYPSRPVAPSVSRPPKHNVHEKRNDRVEEHKRPKKENIGKSRKSSDVRSNRSGKETSRKNLREI